MASLIDKYAEFVANRRSSGDGVVRRVMDPNYLTPDVFYAMDEEGKSQRLHRFDKSSGVPVYTGTFHIMFKTEDMNRFCLIMTRIEDKWRIPEDHRDPEADEMERKVFIAAEYYPGTQGRIYLRGLSGPALERVVARYEKRCHRKLELPAVALQEKEKE